MATTVVVGTAALRAGLAPEIGCVTMLEPFRSLDLPGVDELVFGGHDVIATPLLKRAEQLADAGVVPAGLPSLVEADINAADAEIRISPGGAGSQDQAATIDALIADLTDFRLRHELARVIVVNVSSTEARSPARPAHASLDALRAALAADEAMLPGSSLYAYAALSADCPFVDFTPSTGARIPALGELAEQRGLPYAGSDGKTGETLVKSVLAPMFARRGLRVRAWTGTNLLGGGDGAALADPARVGSKVESKRRMLAEALGYAVDDGVHIHNVPVLGDWKTAWDHIVFDGFLGVRMTMQFTWQGCDSALAAPLVLDLVRLVACAQQAGIAGPLPQLAFFFKDPIRGADHGLEQQYQTLLNWAAELPRAADSR